MPTFLIAMSHELALGQLSYSDAFIAWAVSMLLINPQQSLVKISRMALTTSPSVGL